MNLKKAAFVFWVFSALSEGQPIVDKNVRWGYKVTYAKELKIEAIKKLRKTLQSKGVSILYPADNNRGLSTKFFSVASSLNEEEIKAISPEIQGVEPAENTHLLTLKFRDGLDAKEIKRILELFPHYKIQVLAQGQELGPLRVKVKTSLVKEQIKSSPSFGSLIEVIEN